MRNRLLANPETDYAFAPGDGKEATEGGFGDDRMDAKKKVEETKRTETIR